MRQTVNDYQVVRAIIIDGNTEGSMTVVADGEFVYIPQIVTFQQDGAIAKTAYYLEIPKRLLQEGVGTLDD